MNKKFIVTTTINDKTEALEKYESLKDWTLIVVGDKKTPRFNVNGIYLTPEDQEKIDNKLSDLTGWNCIQRRNFGFIEAYRLGADIVATIDDDNIPFDGWGEDVIVGENIKHKKVYVNEIVFDPLSFCLKTQKNLWYRGYPIQLLGKREHSHYEEDSDIFDVQTSMWLGNPDVDAICNMEHNPFLKAEDYADVFPFSSNKFSPFNSQNTFISRKALKYYFMFPHVGRMDDIWNSFYLQAIGFKVCYTKPTVTQIRNEHSLTKDFEREVIGYVNNEELLKSLSIDEENIRSFLPEKSYAAFEKYKENFE